MHNYKIVNNKVLGEVDKDFPICGYGPVYMGAKEIQETIEEFNALLEGVQKIQKMVDEKNGR